MLDVHRLINKWHHWKPKIAELLAGNTTQKILKHPGFVSQFARSLASLGLTIHSDFIVEGAGRHAFNFCAVGQIWLQRRLAECMRRSIMQGLVDICQKDKDSGDHTLPAHKREGIQDFREVTNDLGMVAMQALQKGKHLGGKLAETYPDLAKPISHLEKR